MGLVREFQLFLLRGNVIDLAVGVVMGVAFSAVVSSLVEDLLTPLIAAIFAQPDFSDLTFTLNESTFRYGEFINALIAFITIAATLFFFVIKPVNTLISLARLLPTPDPTTQKCLECLSEIPINARKCAFCTSPVPG